MKKEYKCPKDNSVLVKKRIEYGMPSVEMMRDENIILGGCCVPEPAPKWAYECPKCKSIFFTDKEELIVPNETEVDEDKDKKAEEDKEIEEIDDDIQDLETLDFLEDEF
ncbi:MAG: hypothetical protein V1739_06150 [Candidatus Omnitrophota bacterium]